MNKVLTVIIVLFVVGGIGVGVYIYTQNSSQDENITLNEETTFLFGGKKAEEAKKYTGNWEKIKALGIPLKCSFSYTFPDGEGNTQRMKGEGVTKGDNFRGSWTIMDTKWGMLVKDNCIYSWNEQEKMGSKICVDPLETDVSDTGQWPNELVCVPTVLKGNEFTPPSDINFLDLQDMYNMQFEGSN